MTLAGAEVAEQIRYRVRMETQLTCSVGLGPNTMLAKVASDINKPNGQYALPEDPAAIRDFVQSLSLRKVPGIGKVSTPRRAFVFYACQSAHTQGMPPDSGWLVPAWSWSCKVLSGHKLHSIVTHMASMYVC